MPARVTSPPEATVIVPELASANRVRLLPEPVTVVVPVLVKVVPLWNWRLPPPETVTVPSLVRLS